MATSPVLERAPLAPLWCWAPVERRWSIRCPEPAGKGTKHPGYGPCVLHEPMSMRRAWEAAMTAAGALRVSPWDALLMLVDVAAQRVAWVDRQLVSAAMANDGDLDSSTVRRWLRESRLERSLLAKHAKTAIDAGLVGRITQQIELEGRVMADTLDVGLSAIGAPPDLRIRAMEAAHAHLSALESISAPTVWTVPTD